jgi:hypothetical protein
MMKNDTIARSKKHNSMLQQGISILLAHKGRQKDKIKSSEKDIVVYSASEGEVYEARVVVAEADIRLRQSYGEVTDNLISFLEGGMK